MLIQMKFEVFDAWGVRGVEDAHNYVRPLLAEDVEIVIHDLGMPYSQIMPGSVPVPTGGTNFSGTAWISTAS